MKVGKIIKSLCGCALLALLAPAVGVPEISPVDAFSVRPAGKVPVTICQL